MFFNLFNLKLNRANTLSYTLTWVVDMDQFVAYALDPYALDPYALDQEEVPVNQFQLFPLQFLPLMMETVVIVHNCHNK